MKGFIYLLEISIALILMLVVLATVSSYSVKESWERVDLVTIGNNVVNMLDFYDSGILCFEGEDGIDGDEYNVSQQGYFGYDPPDSNCGPSGHYFIGATTGIYVFKTPALPKEGDYTLVFDYNRGDPPQPAEDFSVGCGGRVYNFPDDADSKAWRWKNVACHFNQGVNYFNFTSTGADSVWFDSFRIIGNGNIIGILNGNLNGIGGLVPPNVDFGLRVLGIPESNISIGCTDAIDCSYLDNLLTDTYVNNRWINFSIEQFDIVGSIGFDYDAVVLINFTEYSTQKSKIIDYLNRGGVIVGINTTFDNNDGDFNDIFGLNPTNPNPGGENFNFTRYNPSKDEIEKYFLGLGFDIETSNTIDSKKWGNWNIWDEERKVNITTSNTIDVENKTIDEGIIQDILEGENFNLKGPDNNFYTFKVKKIFWDKDLVIIQPVNTSFIFKDFSEANDVTGKVNIVSLFNDQAVMASNNTAIWISDFPEGDEYMALVKAALASRVKEWIIKEPDLTKEYVAISSFFPLCCDMPEIAELTFYLWYKI